MKGSTVLFVASDLVCQLALVGESAVKAIRQCVLISGVWRRCVWIERGLRKAEGPSLDKVDHGAVPGLEDRRKFQVPVRQCVCAVEVRCAAGLAEACGPRVVLLPER